MAKVRDPWTFGRINVSSSNGQMIQTELRCKNNYANPEMYLITSICTKILHTADEVFLIYLIY